MQMLQLPRQSLPISINDSINIGDFTGMFSNLLLQKTHSPPFNLIFICFVEPCSNGIQLH